MTIPIIIGLSRAIGAAMTARNGYIVAGVFAVFKEDILAAVYHALEGEGFGGWLASVANSKLDAAGIDLRFRDLLDSEKTKADVDAFAARRLNAKAGTNFTTLKDISRDALLTELSKTLARSVNSETGSKITALWPVETLRRELGTELARQFDDGADLSAGGIFPAANVEAVKLAIAKKMDLLTPSPNVASGSFSFWPPAADDKQALRRANGRARQAEYRRSHKQVWVPS